MSISESHKSGTKLSSPSPQKSHWFIVIIFIAVSIRMTCLQTVSAFVVSNQFSTRGCTFARSMKKRRHDGTQSTSRLFHCAATSDTESSNINKPDTQTTEMPVSLYRSEGIFAVEKPLNWTSSDVVSYIRGILERDARQRGAKPGNVRSRRSKSPILRVGHGGTLDPLASGVLVIGVGKGTKELQR